MWLPNLLTSALLVAASVASTPATIQTELLYQPVASSSKPIELARISYDPVSLRSRVISYTPPQLSSSNDKDADLIRIGAYPEPNSWVGVLSSLSVFKPSSTLPGSDVPTILLYLDSRNRVYHVGISSQSSAAGTQRTQAGKPSGVNVEVVRSEPAAVPQLNKAIVRRADDEGEEQEEVPFVNSLLQKYWWLLPIVLLLAVGGGGS
ncbi:uncharacterized protein GIQ15_06367 [Arthroderma uncinatum]|uniref:uncharacterized protein n=1 Tax=Arthroderma uncinatum TaxID=74035 RepID=UPI00144AE82F|nr:uncharacterized protein GIQ15_06367 [Arthroderma uncinatum]KAF3481020.1 hypothetical protein GIQ15_06367 [Arthroderma uncinatum]